MKFKASIMVGFVKADSIEEARKKARDTLNYYAESNDGSELLANAKPILEEVPSNTPADSSIINIERLMKAISVGVGDRCGCNDGDTARTKDWIKLAKSEKKKDHTLLFKLIADAVANGD